MAEKLNLTLRVVQRLRRSLNCLDAIKSDVDGRVTHLDFSMPVRVALMRNAAAVEVAGLVVDRLDRELAEEIGVFEGMEKNDANGRLMDVYRRKLETLLDQTTDVELVTVKLGDLLTRSGADPKKPAQLNPIPQSVLYGLAPIIAEDGA